MGTEFAQAFKLRSENDIVSTLIYVCALAFCGWISINENRARVLKNELVLSWILWKGATSSTNPSPKDKPSCRNNASRTCYVDLILDTLTFWMSSLSSRFDMWCSKLPDRKCCKSVDNHAEWLLFVQRFVECDRERELLLCVNGRSELFSDCSTYDQQQYAS